MITMNSAEERFRNLYDVDDESGCWIWRGSITPNGYGQFRVSTDLRVQSHRFSHELATGRATSPDLVIDHLCNRKSCVNPKHLRAVTQGENVRRYWGHKDDVLPDSRGRRTVRNIPDEVWGVAVSRSRDARVSLGRWISDAIRAHAERGENT